MRASTCEEGRGAVVAASSCEASSLGRETTEAGADASGPVRLIHILGLLGLNIKGHLVADKNFKPEEERRCRVRLDHTRLHKGQDVRIKAGYELYRKMEYEDEQQQQKISLMMMGCGRQW